MGDVPDIVREMKEQERIGMLNCKIQEIYEEPELVEETSDNVPDETVAFIEDDIRDTANNYHSEDLYRLIAENTSDLISITTFSLKPVYTYVSPSNTKILGYKPEEIIGKNVFYFMHPDDKKKLSPLIKKYVLLKTKQLFNRKKHEIVEKLEFRVRDKSGNWHYLETTANIIGNELLFISKDITEKKKNDGRLRDIINSMIDWTWEIDKLGKYRYTSKKVKEIMEYEPEEMIGKSPFDFMLKDEAEYIGELFKKIASEKKPIVDLENWNISKNGKKICLLTNGVPILDDNGDLIGYRGVDKDITERKQAEKDLKDAHQMLRIVNKDLERKVEIKTKEIQNQNDNLTSMNEELISTQQELKENIDKVERLVEQKDEFIHMLGHDLKNPMTPIFTLLPLIEKKIEDEQSKNVIQVVIQSTHKMKEIIDETLKLARLEDVGRTIEPVDIVLFDEIGSIIEENKVLLDENEFIVENNIDNSLHVMADKFQFGELINNFITNAIKYTPDDKKGVLKINAMIKDDFVEVSFCDNGVGMTEKQIGHVFDKFYKAETPRKGMTSSGLGLAICENIVKKHGGQIRVESSGLGNGSTFYFTLKSK